MIMNAEDLCEWYNKVGDRSGLEDKRYPIRR